VVLVTGIAEVVGEFVELKAVVGDQLHVCIG
jgi:hypothetical protein